MWSSCLTGFQVSEDLKPPAALKGINWKMIGGARFYHYIKPLVDMCHSETPKRKCSAIQHYTVSPVGKYACPQETEAFLQLQLLFDVLLYAFAAWLRCLIKHLQSISGMKSLAASLFLSPSRNKNSATKSQANLILHLILYVIYIVWLLTDNHICMA